MPDERARSQRYAEVKKRIGLSSAGRTADFTWKPPLGASILRAGVAATAANGAARSSPVTITATGRWPRLGTSRRSPIERSASPKGPVAGRT